MPLSRCRRHPEESDVCKRSRSRQIWRRRNRPEPSSAIERYNMYDARRANGVARLLTNRAKRGAMLICLLAAVTAFGDSAAAEVRKLPTRIAAAFDLDDIIGKVRFCYDRAPEIIYFRYARETDRTSVEARSIDGAVRTLFEFPGMGDPRSLSCSVDGSAIAALNGEQNHLYLFKASQLSVYKLVPGQLYSVRGEYSLLSGNGSMISAPDEPTHVSGPDALAQMQFSQGANKRAGLLRRRICLHR
jgi:hypothetical protein